MKHFALITSLTSLLVSEFSLAAEKPNILWIVSEDNDYQWLSCYGNEQAQTPNLDAMAAEGARFKYAYSNAPVCAVARSTIINGVYAPTQGTQHMRSRHPISPRFKPYTAYLQEQGYYCTNHTKTDYNFLGDDHSYWDESGKKAHYKNRPEGTPFFSVINLTVSHESSLFENRIKTNRKKGIIPKTPRIDPADVELRPYLPDLPEIRNDIAIYHDVITALDTQIGEILDELEKAGLAEDTIVMYYGDHGGITPRGKRYIKESGTRVPMLLYVPENWKHLSPFKTGQVIEEPVSFIDLAPTLLSIVNVKKPEQMQGRALLGKYRAKPATNETEFLFADRFDEFYGMRRGLTTGKWKYIRRFTPNLAAAPYSYYQFDQAGWQAWQDAWKAGKLPEKYAKIWKNNQLIEELYDLESDPWEVNNLALNADHAKRLKAMRGQLKSTMLKIKDTGLIPESMFAELSADKPISDYLAKSAGDIKSLIELAFQATARDPKNVESFLLKINDKNPLVRYWALQGLLILDPQVVKSYEEELTVGLIDKFAANRITTANIYFNLGRREHTVSTLMKILNGDLDEYAKLSAINVLNHCHLTAKISNSWIIKALNDKQTGKYIQRLASQLAKSRGLKVK